MKQRNTRIFSYVLTLFIPIVMIPVLMISIFPFFKTTGKIQARTSDFYSSIVLQVVDNVDFYYNRYVSIFQEISRSALFRNIVNRPEQTAIEQVKFHYDGIEEKGMIGLLDFVRSKTKGAFCLIELDRQDPIKKTPFTIALQDAENTVFEVEGIQNEPFFLKMKEDKQVRPVMGYSYSIETSVKNRRVIFFCPYWKDEKKEIRGIMLILEMQDFLSRLYSGQTGLKFGTLYLMDQFDNVLDVNHPSVNDYYDYDKESGKYVLNPGDDPNDKYEGMSFVEYRMLNTDQEILRSKQVEALMEQYRQKSLSEPECQVIHYKGERFLFIYMKAKDSLVQAAYFYPLKQVYQSFYWLVLKIFLIVLATLVLVLMIGRKFSKRFSDEIQQLIAAHEQVSQGNYSSPISLNSNLKEFAELEDSFNFMLKTVSRNNKGIKEKIEAQSREILRQTDELVQFNKVIQQEKEHAVSILRNILPEKVLHNLTEENSCEPEWFENVSILFCGIADIYRQFEKVESKQLMAELNSIFDAFDGIMERNNCIRIKTGGDIYIAACGLLEEDTQHAVHLVKAGRECLAYVERRNQSSRNPLQIRVGVHSGAVAGAIAGTRKYSYDLFGDTVNIAYLLETQTPAGKLCVSWVTYKLVAGRFRCSKLDELKIKGRNDLETFLVEDEFFNRMEKADLGK